MPCSVPFVIPTIKNKHFSEEIPSSVSGIDFVNKVENTEDFNIFNYRNFYNGGGVALGDINNDGLVDVFTSNMGENKLTSTKVIFILKTSRKKQCWRSAVLEYWRCDG
ncbi:MAG: hypothetical protein R2778_12845 [Saprospiraceae bacterium]